MKRFAVLAAAGLVAATGLTAQTQPQGGYGLRPGDQVETTFYTAGGDALGSVGGNRIVDRDGDVFYPFIGTTKVEGLDAIGIRELLAQKFQPFYKDPVITVNVKLRVNITGIVGSPGHYLLEPTATIVDAVAQAGGTGLDFQTNAAGAAQLEKVRLIRDGQTIILNLRPEDADPKPMEMRVQSGDWIYVPPQPRSRIRDDISFFGTLLGAVTSVVAVIVLFTK